MADNNAALTIAGDQFLALSYTPDELRELIRDNLGDGSFNVNSVERVRVPSGGARSWEVTDLDSKSGVASTPEIHGIIIYWHATRTFYRAAYSGENNPPDCSSPDGVQGYGDPGVLCDTCPFSKWGSDIKGGRGQACRLQRVLYVLRPNELIPVAVQLPPTSLQPASVYFQRLMSRGIKHHEVSTRISLESVDKPPTPKYSRAAFAVGDRLTPDQIAVVRQMRDSLIPFLTVRRTETVETSEDDQLEDDQPL